MCDWLDIETAPKDEGYILVCVLGFPPQIAQWKNGTWDAFDEARFAFDVDETKNGYEYHPTHWMPLPQPPVEAPNDLP